MYKEIYTIPFKSIEENSYIITIEKKGYVGTSTELVGAANPFTVEQNTDSPFQPFNLSSATLSIFGGDYLRELFTPDPQGVRVTLYRNNQLEWTGFVTNDIYSQDYSNIEFVYEIELVNPISTLKYSKYSDKDKNVSFINLIKEAIQETNSKLTTLYLPSSYTNELDENIYDLIEVASGNFMDEQEEFMTYYEILEEIAKYLGLTITIKNDAIYFIDYIGLGKGFRGYYKYNLTTNTVTSTDTLYHNETIQSLGYASDNSSLHINSGKNKTKITCSLYDIDQLLPEFNSDGAVYQFMKRKIYAYGEGDNEISNAYVMRFFDQSKYTFYKYGYDGVPVNPPTGGGDRPGGRNPWGDDDDPSQDRIKGSWFVRTANYPRQAIIDRANPIPTINFTNEVLVRRYSDLEQAKLGKVLREVPVFTIKSDKKYNFKPNTSLLLNFDIKFLEDNPLYWEEGSEHKGKSFRGNIDLKIKIRIGEYYFNGARSWDKVEKKYNNWVTVDKGDFYGKYYPFPNNVHFEDGLADKSGNLIITPDFVINGDIELTIYNPVFDDVKIFDKTHTFITRNGKKSYPQYMLIKDIEISLGNEVEDIWKDKEDDKEEGKNDIVYENEIDDKFVDEADEINLKICTYPDNYNKLCWSATIINNKYLKTLKYNPLNLTDKPEIILINKIVDYYKEPKYEISIPVRNKPLYPYSIITDSNIPGKNFIYIGNEINYEYEKNTINILEI